MWRFRNRLENRVQVEFELDIKEIYAQEYRRIVEKLGPDIANQFPTYKFMQPTLSRRRNAGMSMQNSKHAQIFNINS